MFKASLIGIGVTLLLLMIPVVHFVSGPLGPFIGGFIGGSKAEVIPDVLTYGQRSLGAITCPGILTSEFQLTL